MQIGTTIKVFAYLTTSGNLQPIRGEASYNQFKSTIMISQSKSTFLHVISVGIGTQLLSRIRHGNGYVGINPQPNHAGKSRIEL